MNRKIYLIVFVFIFIIIFCGNISNADVARTPTWPNDSKFTRGVSNCCYYVDSTAVNYSSVIHIAAKNWEITGFGWNPIYINKVSSNKGTHIDIYQRSPFQDRNLTRQILGYTSFWNASSQNINAFPNEPNSSYFYTEIILNSVQSISKGTITHELGHAFGLAHYNSNTKSIMCQQYKGREVSEVQKCDHESINYLY